MEKKMMTKVLRRSFFLGMTSVFFPFNIPVEPIETPQESDTENLANDWKQVGSYIRYAYEARES